MRTEGLPYTNNGKAILIHVPTYRQWLMGRMKNVRREPRDAHSAHENKRPRLL